MKTLSKTFPALAGCVLGVVAAWTLSFISFRQADEPQRVLVGKVAGAAKAAPASGASTEADQKRVRALEQRLLELERQTEAEQAHEDQASEHEAPAVPPEQARAELLAEWQDQLDAHETEPRNAKWAPAAEASFQHDLEQLATRGQGYQIAKVDCRSTTCAAQLEWSDFNTAVHGYEGVIGQRYGINCATRIQLPEPGEGQLDQKYRATLLFDCSEATTGDWQSEVVKL
jgi:hypothetical protein